MAAVQWLKQIKGKLRTIPSLKCSLFYWLYKAKHNWHTLFLFIGHVMWATFVKHPHCFVCFSSTKGKNGRTSGFPYYHLLLSFRFNRTYDYSRSHYPYIFYSHIVYLRLYYTMNRFAKWDLAAISSRNNSKVALFVYSFRRVIN